MSKENPNISISNSDIEHIDLLVEKGLYKNYMDFINTAVHNELALQTANLPNGNYNGLFGLQSVENDFRKFRNEITALEKYLSATSFFDSDFLGSGVVTLSTKDLEAIHNSGKKISIKVFGILIINKKITPELFANTIKQVEVSGHIFASREIKNIIAGL